MRIETKRFLKDHKFVIGFPVEVRLKKIDGEYIKFLAKMGDYVVKWEDVLKAFKIDEERKFYPDRRIKR